MTVMTSIYALDARRRRLSAPLSQVDAPGDAPISPRVVYPAVIAVSLLLWAALAELVIFLVRLPLFS